MSSREKNLLFIRLIVPAGEAIPVPPLSATLGQSQVNANDFCKQFNLRSSIYEVGTLLSIHIFRSPNGTFNFTINRIFLPFLLYQSVELDDRTIFIEKLYDVFRIYSRFTSTTVSFTSLTSQFFGVIRASKFTIIL
jgi:Ribosomal protein L11, N-terminal domain